MSHTIGEIALIQRVRRRRNLPVLNLKEDQGKVDKSLRKQTDKAKISAQISRLSHAELVDYIYELKEKSKKSNN